MKTLSLPQQRKHVPHAASEQHLPELPEPSTGNDGPQLNEPHWKKEVPLYFLVGGTASAAALTACIADWLSGDDRLVNHARWIAAGGGLVSGVLLSKNQGLRQEFTDMLHVFKRQSPVRAGAWTLAIFSTFSGAAAFANQMRQQVDAMPILVFENVSGTVAAVMGLLMSTYDVPSGGNWVPLWNGKTGEPPAHFAASGMNRAVSILELLGHDDSRALNLLGLASVAYESLEGLMLENKDKGARDLMARAGNLLSGPLPLVLRTAHMITGNRGLRRAAAYFSLAGSLLASLGRMHAGNASANDCQLPLELTA